MCVCVYIQSVSLQEKSDSNLKLIYERIKAASLQKAIQDEKDLLGNQIVVLSAEKSRFVHFEVDLLITEHVVCCIG